ncbi:sugar transferase [Sarcina ventriculi]|uniref:Colanic biosynthesis UDP-glucose lipid carrier transferase n=1 Tax=Sarcina ventriculi TaxID=1267 RepID=A0ABM9UP12_SARVE|nr:sugar transferase [Sarcina ventriculi]MBU5322699.1 sugar transferase [Sarcina ventriculi]MDD7373880.1 sugar transferase [Sarcina ventriculi]CUN73880.1 Putative colanic biosynthesis UDP-glucose lipid carrier transferase [Sarcina ventriculi]
MQNIKEIKLNSKISNKSFLVYNFFKRSFDIISASIGILFLLPLFIVLAILVKLDSKGPIFFSHKRIGKNGKIIGIYKFRSMVSNSEEIFKNFTEEQKKEFEKNFKLDDDPRITKIGGFLRKTSLDELPQLLNIIKGDMSVVGPRPIVRAEVEKYGVCADKLFSVKPGLTGFWQANGRSDTTYEERVQMDMYYIDNRSFLLDMRIILKTVISVIRKEGAV